MNILKADGEATSRGNANLHSTHKNKTPWSTENVKDIESMISELQKDENRKGMQYTNSQNK